MEFSFNINTLLRDEVTRIDRSSLRLETDCGLHRHLTRRAASAVTHATRGVLHAYETDQNAQLLLIIDTLGENSARAQGLLSPVTNAARLANSEHRLYILKDARNAGGQGAVLGFMKVGVKRLYVVDNEEQMREVLPLCVLDFYVSEACQRAGHGRRIFEHVMHQENVVHPCILAYDHPSPKYIAFLNKYYGLRDYRKQANNYVVFREFFESAPAPQLTGRGPRQRLAAATMGQFGDPGHRHVAMTTDEREEAHATQRKSDEHQATVRFAYESVAPPHVRTILPPQKPSEFQREQRTLHPASAYTYTTQTDEATRVTQSRTRRSTEHKCEHTTHSTSGGLARTPSSVSTHVNDNPAATTYYGAPSSSSTHYYRDTAPGRVVPAPRSTMTHASSHDQSYYMGTRTADLVRERTRLGQSGTLSQSHLRTHSHYIPSFSTTTHSSTSHLRPSTAHHYTPFY